MVVTKEQKDRALKVWQHIKTSKADSHESKADMIRLYNDIYKTNYKVTSNCGSCLRSCFQGIKQVVENGKVRM
tara:strand:+ start:1250 stop:1468 length:219 start_codon:yes stop_codon:yes gene_type:complete